MTSEAQESLRYQRPSRAVNTDISPEIRGEPERDVDRLLYTYYFRRLAEITQVSSYSARSMDAKTDEPLLHNRITHSLKVGQVGRRIAQYLRADRLNADGIAIAGLSEDVVQAAGLAHDLGHPPFGHIGEQVLDRFALDNGLSDGFEGNAQTFRILTRLTEHLPDSGTELVQGLDLTYATLAACCKYPWSRAHSGYKWRKFGYYNDDSGHFDDYVQPLLPDDDEATLEAAIMDWADDISYAVHDIEDFAIAGMIPLSALRHRCENPRAPFEHRVYLAMNSTEMDSFWDYASARLRGKGRVPTQEARKLFAKYASNFPLEATKHEDFSAAAMGRLVSDIITDASKATSVSSTGRLVVEDDMRMAIDVLKQLTWFYVIDRPALVREQEGQRLRLKTVLQGLLAQVEVAFAQEVYEPWDKDREAPRQLGADEVDARTKVLDMRLRGLIDRQLRYERLKIARDVEGTRRRQAIICRGVVDYVASLREREVESLHVNLSG